MDAHVVVSVGRAARHQTHVDSCAAWGADSVHRNGMFAFNFQMLWQELSVFCDVTVIITDFCSAFQDIQQYFVAVVAKESVGWLKIGFYCQGVTGNDLTGHRGYR